MQTLQIVTIIQAITQHSQASEEQTTNPINRKLDSELLVQKLG